MDIVALRVRAMQRPRISREYPYLWALAHGGSLEALAHWRELAAEAEAVVAEIQGLRWAVTELVAEGAD
jgi:hypothetical protein